MAATTVPGFDHIVVVIEENHSYSQIIGSASAPYINSLAKGGALFTDSHGVTHPSQPNYIAFFTGSTQGVTTDGCPTDFPASVLNLSALLEGFGFTFTGYSETMPSVGYTGCSFNKLYFRKHNPWADFASLPATQNQPFTSFPDSANYASLPSLAVVVPNQLNDMHSGTIERADTWLKTNIDAYAQWAKANNSLLIVTWDENDRSPGNKIPTIFYGANVKTGKYTERINHYNVLRTIEASFGLPGMKKEKALTPILDCWSTPRKKH
ncbi:MAG TPA: alkaline phosphatase family protein [Stenomitos sp.]